MRGTMLPEILVITKQPKELLHPRKTNLVAANLAVVRYVESVQLVQPVRDRLTVPPQRQVLDYEIINFNVHRAFNYFNYD